MPVWRNIARLAGLGPLQGVVDPGPTDVITPAQLVQVGDDVSHTIPPVIVPVSIFSAQSPIVAVRFATVEIQAGPRGTHLEFLVGFSAADTPGNLTMEAWTTATTLANRAAVAGVQIGALPSLTTCTVGDAAALGAPSSIHRSGVSFLTVPDLFLPAGEILFISAQTAGVFGGVVFLAQDVP